MIENSSYEIDFRHMQFEAWCWAWLTNWEKSATSCKSDGQANDGISSGFCTNAVTKIIQNN
jgi:hypothetical protein